jgi:hypothetical protein
MSYEKKKDDNDYYEAIIIIILIAMSSSQWGVPSWRYFGFPFCLSLPLY